MARKVSHDALRRQLLQEAVRANIDVIQGRYRFRRPSRLLRLQAAAKVFFLLAVPIALFFSSYLIASVAEDWLDVRESATPKTTAAGTPAAAVGEAQAAEISAGDQALLDGPLPVLSEEQLAELSTAPRVHPSAFPLEVRRVVVDPGHGGENTGTRAPSGLVEKDMALDISLRLEEILVAAGFDVALTRDQDRFVSLEERAEFANRSRGDLFVSIHLNWLETRQVRGIETYYLGPTDDPYLTQLAAEENRDSGYSLADFRRMLDRVYANVRQEESERFAASMQRSLYSALRRVNPHLQDRGVKKAPFIVLTGTDMPAILAEVSCLSNEQEARLLMTPEYRQYIAEALFEGIDDYARNVGGVSQTGS